MDDTFDTTPNIFSQHYVIRAPLGESSVSCVYALLSDKSQSTYEELIIAIQNRCNDLEFQPNPTTVIMDFEQAAINAVTNTIGPHVHIQGCFYHLTQSTWRKIQSMWLVTLYSASEDVRHFCGMLDGLAFLPVDCVVNGLQFLKQNIPAYPTTCSSNSRGSHRSYSQELCHCWISYVFRAPRRTHQKHQSATGQIIYFLLLTPCWHQITVRYTKGDWTHNLV